MYRVVFTKSFLSNFKKLPNTIQVKTDTLVGLLSVDFRDSRLHTKKLRGSNDLYSFRIGREYRAIFMFIDGDTIKVFDIKHRKDIYKHIK